MINITILVLFGCAVVATLVVYRSCVYGKRRLRIQDIFYLGHVFILTLVLFCSGVGGYLFITRHPRHSDFKEEQWKAEPERRVELVDDLMHRRLLDSKDVAGVKALLGKPVRVFDDSLGYRLAYYLGVKRGPFSTDPDFLIVGFSKEHVGDYYIKPGVPYIN
jgi:hypothetical protein